MHNIPLCRSFTYYVDSSSTSSVEFGTEGHPYKSYDSVNIELMNYHTGNDRSVTVYVKEETINYWLLDTIYVSNITAFSIKTYSSVRTNPNKAAFVGVEIASLVIAEGMPTKFNILGMSVLRSLILEPILNSILKQILNNHNIANTNILTTLKINQNSNLPAREIISFDLRSVIFSSHRSNIHFDNLLLTTEYVVLVSGNQFFSTINVVPKEMNITN
jgi:hypothetical protein